MSNEDRSCFFCKWNKIDSDCSQTEVCKNFERNELDKIIDTIDCIPLDVVKVRDSSGKHYFYIK